MGDIPLLELEDSILLICYFSPKIFYRFEVMQIKSAIIFIDFDKQMPNKYGNARDLE